MKRSQLTYLIVCASLGILSTCIIFNLKSDMRPKITGLHSVYLDISTQFRDGVEWFFVKLHEKKVPVLIISAGLGGICRLYPCLC